MQEVAWPYRDSSLSVDERVKDLLGRMTIEEKIVQMCSRWASDVITKDDGVTDANCKKQIGLGIGHIARPAACTSPMGRGKGDFQPEELVRQINAVQRFLVTQTRLGIPAIFHEESLCGATMRGATMFPQAINYASTWNPELIERVAGTIREHMRSVGLHQALSPLLDVCRDPRWGRTEETFGEDPYLVAAIGCAYIKGLQGANLTKGVVATAKHFIAYGSPEGGHNVGSVRVGPRELREIHGYSFEAAIRSCGLESIMHAYHEIDGVPCVASRELLTDLLRGEMGFKGMVVSDYGALWMLFDAHKVAADLADAARQALYAGLDSEIPDGWAFEPSLPILIKEGKVPVSLVDQAVARILRLKFLLGLFEAPYADEKSVSNTGFDSPEHRDLARQTAVESITLLKNDSGILPLTNAKTIAVIGPNADSVAGLLGDYTFAHCAKLRDIIMPTPTILSAIQQQAPAECKVLYAKGCDIKNSEDDYFKEAEKLAGKSDVVIAVMGEDSFTWSGENRDRTSLSLPGNQELLLHKLRATDKPVVLVLLSGRPLSTRDVENDCDAILQAWYPGEEGGAAIASILFGRTSPSGRLPISIPEDVGHIPCHYNRRPFSAAGGSVDSGGQIRPLYPFGHGLSYTAFSYGNLRIAPNKVQPGGSVNIRAEITNTGERSGIETVQLYLHDAFASVSRPISELKGFQRIELQPGETAAVLFEVPMELLAFWDKEMNLVVEPGLIEVKIGASAADIRLEGSFEVAGAPLRLSHRSIFFSFPQTEKKFFKAHGKEVESSAGRIGKHCEQPIDFVGIASRPPDASN